jgi:transposase
MPKIKYRFTLTKEEQEELRAIVRKGKHNAQKILSALILLNCDESSPTPRRMRDQEIAEVLKVSAMKVHRVKQRFVEEGLEIALNGHKGQRVYEKKADGEFEAHLVALSCSAPPPGYLRWSLRLLADKVVELQYADSISYETVRRVLKKTNSSLGKSMGGSSRRSKTRSL